VIKSNNPHLAGGEYIICSFFTVIYVFVLF
jgi:hypothetical protein